MGLNSTHQYLQVHQIIRTEKHKSKNIYSSIEHQSRSEFLSNCSYVKDWTVTCLKAILPVKAG